MYLAFDHIYVSLELFLALIPWWLHFRYTNKGTKYWLGLEKTGSRWRWIGETKDTSDPGFGYSNTWRGRGDCVVHNYDVYFYSFWNYVGCRENQVFICQRETLNTSRDSFCVSDSEKCYYRRIHKVTWVESQDACLAEGLVLMSQSALMNYTSNISALITDLGCQAHFWLDNENYPTGNK